MGNSKTKPEQTNSKDDKTNSTNSSNPQLQIRNCVRNVRNINAGNFSDMYPDNVACGS